MGSHHFTIPKTLSFISLLSLHLLYYTAETHLHQATQPPPFSFHILPSLTSLYHRDSPPSPNPSTAQPFTISTAPTHLHLSRQATTSQPLLHTKTLPITSLTANLYPSTIAKNHDFHLLNATIVTVFFTHRNPFITFTASHLHEHPLSSVPPSSNYTTTAKLLSLFCTKPNPQRHLTASPFSRYQPHTFFFPLHHHTRPHSPNQPSSTFSNTPTANLPSSPQNPQTSPSQANHIHDPNQNQPHSPSLTYPNTRSSKNQTNPLNLQPLVSDEAEPTPQSSLKTHETPGCLDFRRPPCSSSTVVVHHPSPGLPTTSHSLRHCCLRPDVAYSSFARR